MNYMQLSLVSNSSFFFFLLFHQLWYFCMGILGLSYFLENDRFHHYVLSSIPLLGALFIYNLFILYVFFFNNNNLLFLTSRFFFSLQNLIKQYEFTAHMKFLLFNFIKMLTLEYAFENSILFDL